MASCPICGLALWSTAQAARSLGVTSSRVRALVAQDAQRLPAARVGWGWLVAAQGVTEFRPQPSGVRLQRDTRPSQTPPRSTCPECGELFLSVGEAAKALGITDSGVYAILTRYKSRLMAFQVGGRWYIPESGVADYNQGKNGGSGNEESGPGAGREAVVEVEPRPCWCSAYSFPHRPGSGKCPNGSKRALRHLDKGDSTDAQPQAIHRLR
jgi:hypothetical protein